MKDYYAILQVRPDASIEVIRASYKTLAKKYHPDSGIGNSDELMRELNEAYSVLSDPEKRQIYDYDRRHNKERNINKSDKNSAKASTSNETHFTNDNDNRKNINFREDRRKNSSADKSTSISVKIITSVFAIVAVGIYSNSYKPLLFVAIILLLYRIQRMREMSGFQQFLTIILSIWLISCVHSTFSTKSNISNNNVGPRNSSSVSHVDGESSNQNESIVKSTELSKEDTANALTIFQMTPGSTIEASKVIYENGIIDNVTTKELKYEDVSWLNHYEASFIMDEILAHHGAKFNNSYVNRYFSRYSWYEPKVDVMELKPKDFSVIELKNLKYLKEVYSYNLSPPDADTTSLFELLVYVDDTLIPGDNTIDILIDDKKIGSVTKGNVSGYYIKLENGKHELKAKKGLLSDSTPIIVDKIGLNELYLTCKHDGLLGVKLQSGWEKHHSFVDNDFHVVDMTKHPKQNEPEYTADYYINYMRRNVRIGESETEMGLILESCCSNVRWIFYPNILTSEIYFSGNMADGTPIEVWYSINNLTGKHGFEKYSKNGVLVDDSFKAYSFVYNLEIEWRNAIDSYTSDAWMVYSRPEVKDILGGNINETTYESLSEDIHEATSETINEKKPETLSASELTDDLKKYNNKEWIIEDSDSRFITDEEIKSLTPQQARMAINEIAARHGRIFKDIEINDFFSSKSWYVPLLTKEVYDVIGDSILNDYEHVNSERLLARKNSETIPSLESLKNKIYLRNISGYYTCEDQKSSGACYIQVLYQGYGNSYVGMIDFGNSVSYNIVSTDGINYYSTDGSLSLYADEWGIHTIWNDGTSIIYYR